MSSYYFQRVVIIVQYQGQDGGPPYITDDWKTRLVRGARCSHHTGLVLWREKMSRRKQTKPRHFDVIPGEDEPTATTTASSPVVGLENTTPSPGQPQGGELPQDIAITSTVEEGNSSLLLLVLSPALL